MSRTLFIALAVLSAVASARAAEPSFAKEPAFEDNFDADWASTQKSWEVATWKQNNTQMSPDRCQVNDQGQLVQTELAGSPHLGGSMQTNREFGFGRWVARVKPSSAAGVNNSIFTKDWDNLSTADNKHDGNKGEVDIEFLTRTFAPGKGQVHLAIHTADEHPHWEKDLDLDFNPSDDFHEWGFDILPDRVRWHVDGKLLHEYVYPQSKPKLLEENYEMFFNSWTQPKWVKGPPSERAEYLIDWVRFHPLESE